MSAVIHVDASGAQCALQPLCEMELLNAVDTLQRHLAPSGIRVSLSTRRTRAADDAAPPARDLVTFNGIEAADLLEGSVGGRGLDSSKLLEAGLAAVRG